MMRSLLTTLAEVVGAVSITTGAFKAVEWLGWIVAGLFLIVGSVLVAE